MIKTKKKEILDNLYTFFIYKIIHTAETRQGSAILLGFLLSYILILD